MRLCKRERPEHEEADQWRKENRNITRKINRKYTTNAYFARKRKKERRKERMKQSERKI